MKLPRSPTRCGVVERGQHLTPRTRVLERGTMWKSNLTARPFRFVLHDPGSLSRVVPEPTDNARIAAGSADHER